MSTNARIGINTPKGIKSIYLHWDGYIDWAGAILIKHYKTEDKVEELIGLGDLSTLSSSIGTKHGYNHDTNVCSAYHRDRGENWEDTKPKMYPTFGAWIRASGNSYNYLFDRNEWRCYDYNGYEIDLT